LCFTRAMTHVLGSGASSCFREQETRGWRIMKSEILREEVVFPMVLWTHASHSRSVKCHRYASFRVDIS